MRIAIFTETYLPQINGVVTHIKILKEGLEALGHTVLIVTADAKAHRHYIEDGVLHWPRPHPQTHLQHGALPHRSAARACITCGNLILISSTCTPSSALA